MATTTQQLTLLYKKNFGVADTKDTNTVSQEGISSRPRIIPSLQVLQQAIPVTVPSDFVKDNSFSALKGQRYTSASYPYIVYYSSIALTHINLYESYWFTDATTANPELNILTTAIPTTYGAGLYATVVYDSGGNPLGANGTYPWVFDTEGGILKFFNYLTSGNAPPKITFYRYEGTFGVPTTFAQLFTSTLQTSTLQLIDLTTNIPGNVTLSNGNIYVNGTIVAGGGIPSTTVGLGTLGYISSLQLTSTVIGLGSSGYVSTASLVSTTAYLLSNAGGTTLTSTLIGLGTAGYISSTQLLSTTSGIYTYISSFVDPTELTSTIVGLGTFGYVSTMGLLSTASGLASYITTFIDPVELASTVAGLGSASFISSLQLQLNITSTVAALARLDMSAQRH